MESIDMKKLETAIIYLQRIAEGNNPVNNVPVPEDSVLNNPNVIRCMFFVKDILEEVKRKNGVIGKKPSKPSKKEFPIESVSSFVYEGDKPITYFVGQLNAAINLDEYKKLGYKNILNWLKSNDYLKEEYNQEKDKVLRAPTEKGIELGIYSDKRISGRGDEYTILLYNRRAQEYIVQNLEQILSAENTESEQ